jgi:DegV family protein with EDD domain
MSIRLVIDSASDISPREAEARGAYFMPMTVRIGGEEYKDGIDISPKEFYEKLVETSDLPQTSQITMYEFGQVFEEIIAAGDTPVAITISSKLSGTYQCAAVAAAEFPGKAYAVDSLNACIGERILVERAFQLIDEGVSPEELVRILDREKEDICLLALLDTLEYLKKGGRISAAAALAGGLLSIKPVISVENGEVVCVGKARGSKHGNNLLNEFISRKGGVDFKKPVVLGYTGLDERLLQKYIADSEKLWKDNTDSLPICPIGSTIGTHVGPGAVAAAFFAEDIRA